jgi:hypothetical protein
LHCGRRTTLHRAAQLTKRVRKPKHATPHAKLALEEALPEEELPG